MPAEKYIIISELFKNCSLSTLSKEYTHALVTCFLPSEHLASELLAISSISQ